MMAASWEEDPEEDIVVWEEMELEVNEEEMVLVLLKEVIVGRLAPVESSGIPLLIKALLAQR
jgi:hypothetical protein